MHFDPTVNLGNIISLVIMLGTLSLSLFKLFRMMDKMQWKMNMIWRWYCKERGIDDDENPPQR
jgi:hypothetical protein